MIALVCGVILCRTSSHVHGQRLVHLDDDRHGAGIDDSRGRGDKGIAGDDHFVAWPDAQPRQRADQRRRARGDGHGVRDLHSLGKLGLKLFDLAQGRLFTAVAKKPARLQHLGNRIQFFLTKLVHSSRSFLYILHT